MLNTLTSPLDGTPWPVFQNVRKDTAPRLFSRFDALVPHATCSCMVSGSLHFPSRVLCSFHSRYYCTIGLKTCLGFEVGAPDFHARFPTHATQKTRHHPSDYPYRAITLSGAAFQRTSGFRVGWTRVRNSTFPHPFRCGFGLPCPVFDRLYSRDLVDFFSSAY